MGEDFVCGPKKVSILKEKMKAYGAEGMGAFTGDPMPVFADDFTTDISKMYKQKEHDIKEELEVLNDSISDALEAAVDAQNAADDLDNIAGSIGWVLGQEEELAK